MASGFAANINLKETGYTVSVPNNDIAKLMYYLKSVTLNCGLDVIRDDLVDYHNYFRLSQERQDLVLVAALEYSPDELLNKVIFLDEDGKLCGTKANNFLDIESSLTLVSATSSVIIAGEQTSISKIMVFKKQWINMFYFEPMQRNKDRLTRIYLRLLTAHCEHCTGRPGACQCARCPRKTTSKCSLSLTSSTSLSSLLVQLQEASSDSGTSKRHCAHCSGHRGRCTCNKGCAVTDASDCYGVHYGIICDGCGENPITGSRLKCVMCPNYDLCATCYRSKKNHLAHPFFHIPRENANRIYIAARQQSKHCSHCGGDQGPCECEHGCDPQFQSKCHAVHKVKCDSCHKYPFEGSRLQCVTCSDYDLCGTCYNKNEVHLTHAFYHIPRVGAKKIFVAAREQSKHCNHCTGRDGVCDCKYGCDPIGESKCYPLHFLICNGCGKTPFIGPKFTCRSCSSFNLCNECYEKDTEHAPHPFSKYLRTASAPIFLQPKQIADIKTTPPPPSARQPLPSKPIPEDATTCQRLGTKFYEKMSVKELKAYLSENNVSFSDIYDIEDLRKRAWECYCDTVSMKELNESLQKLGLSDSDSSSVANRRQKAKEYFKSSYVPQPSSSDIKHDVIPTSGSSFMAGDKVRLIRLKTVEMNGKYGSVVDGNVKNGRLDVLIEDSGRELRVKVENLELSEAEEID